VTGRREAADCACCGQIIAPCHCNGQLCPGWRHLARDSHWCVAMHSGTLGAKAAPKAAPGFVNTRATAGWAARLIGRGSAILIGATYPGHLWAQEIIDHSPADVIELGERVTQYARFPRPATRVRI
jgi:hypothetical protein